MPEIKKTPLNSIHRQQGGKMVEFAGWEMPIQYAGIIKEHHQTRTSVSLFDVCHMGEIFFSGKDAFKNLQNLTCNDVGKLEIGKVQLSALLYENGTFVDDITVYRLTEEDYFICVNAANSDKDYEWVTSHLKGDVVCENRSSQFGQIAIQGKHAVDVLKKITDEPVENIEYYCFKEMDLCNNPVYLARMGYTGEDGFEIFCPHEHTVELWKTLMEHGKEYDIAPAGLGARDTLRLEVCFALYGQDIDDQHLPLEAALGWIVALEKDDFIGKAALVKAKEEGVKQRLIRFALDVRGVPRPHYKIFDESGKDCLGEVTSGTSSPSLGQGIGMGYVPIGHHKIGTKLNIEIRNKMFPATVVKPPFVKVS